MAEILIREQPGDEREAPCHGLDKDKDPYRSTPHAWRSIMKKPEKSGGVMGGWKCPCGQTTMSPLLDHCFHCGAPFPPPPDPENKVCACSSAQAQVRIEVCDGCGGIRSIQEVSSNYNCGAT